MSPEINIAIVDDEKIQMVGSLPVEKRLDNEYTFDIQNLSFSYPGADEKVLKNITETFEVAKNKKLPLHARYIRIRQ